MVSQAQFDLKGVDPLAADFDKIIGATTEEVKPIAIAHEPVSSIDPAPLTHRFRSLVRAVPVARCAGIPAHPQNTFLPVGYVVSIAIAKGDLITRHALRSE